MRGIRGIICRQRTRLFDTASKLAALASAALLLRVFALPLVRRTRPSRVFTLSN